MTHPFAILGAVFALGLTIAMTTPAQAEQKKVKGVERGYFGTMQNGTTVDVYTLTNSRGLKAKIITLGGIVTELHVPDKTGKLGDVVLGFDNLSSYEKGHPFFGCITGRVANRIGNGKFRLDGREYTLAKNNGPNTLHGGNKGIDKAVWIATPIESKEGPSLQLTHTSPDGDEGFPGKLDMVVTYTLTNRNSLLIEYTAKTNRPTILNLTNHSYFNLVGKGDIRDHELMLAADSYTPTDDTLIPTGEIKSVKGTALDFTTPRKIGERIDSIGGDPKGYDHNFVINRTRTSFPMAARVHEPETGRVMEVYTTEPGVQLYTSNFMDGTIVGKRGITYPKYGAFCLETQHFPDAVNKPNFPSTVLRPGQTFLSRTEYVFYTK